MGEAAPTFTPGPWKIGYSDGSGPEYIVGSPGNGRAVATLRWGCDCCKDTPASFADLKPEERANARLIAAAPDLYSALKDMVDAYAEGQDDPDDEPSMVRDAIKALALVEAAP
jgi:hypothetical protein